MGSPRAVHFMECMVRRMMSAVVSIQIHLASPSSHTSSSSMFSVTKMSMAARRVSVLSMDDIELLMGMQS